ETGAASASGTFADYDDAVTITASQGTISQSGNQSGTWSWSQSGLDEGSYTVTITATNADGKAASTNLTIAVTDVAPSVAVTSAPVSIAETGTAVASGTFADYDDAVTITASQGTISQAGNQSGTWSWSQSGLDEGTYTITITATNADGNASS